MKRYNGPIKAGMRVICNPASASAPILWTVSKFDPAALFPVFYEHGDADRGDDSEETFRKVRQPVRPTTADGWRLFLPDAPLADSGAKTFLVGQVYALTWKEYRVVFEVVDDPDERMILASADERFHMPGRAIALRYNDPDARHTVLLFDAPAVPAPAPQVGRRLAEGWTRDPTGGWVCTDVTGVGQCKTTGVRTDAVYIKDDETNAGACEACAETNGVFADAAPVAAPAVSCKPWCGLPYGDFLVPTDGTFPENKVGTSTHDPAFCSSACRERRFSPLTAVAPANVATAPAYQPPAPACDHPRDDKCRVPGGCDVFKRLRESVMKKRGVVASGPTLAVGTYDDDGRFRGRDDSPRGMTFLANLAREKPPAVPAPRVRDIYRVELDSGWVPGSEVR